MDGKLNCGHMGKDVGLLYTNLSCHKTGLPTPSFSLGRHCLCSSILSSKQNKDTYFKLSKHFRKLNLLSVPPKPQFVLPDYHHLSGVLDSLQELHLVQPQPCAGFWTEAVTHLCRFIPLHLSWLKARPGMALLPSSTERHVPKGTRPVCPGSKTCMLQPLIWINPAEKGFVYRTQHNGLIWTLIPQGIKTAS